MNINRVEFVVTFQCTGKCGHCSVSRHLNNKSGPKHVPIEQAVDAMDQISRLFKLSSVMTFGGEPLLYADTVCAIHDKAFQCGVERRSLITNGYFSKEPAVRRRVARSLHNANISGLLLSVDAFHQETIPVEAVYDFATALLETGFQNIRLHPAWVVNEAHENMYNQKTKEILDRFSDLGLPVSNGNNIFMAGAAVEHLSEFYEKTSVNPTDGCGTMPYTEPLTEITSLSIVPNGDVQICGFPIGNINRDTMAEIVSRYDPHKIDWMNAVISSGAAGLTAWAEIRGLSVEGLSCYSVCDLCKKIRENSEVS